MLAEDLEEGQLHEIVKYFLLVIMMNSQVLAVS